MWVPLYICIPESGIRVLCSRIIYSTDRLQQGNICFFSQFIQLTFPFFIHFPIFIGFRICLFGHLWMLGELAEFIFKIFMEIFNLKDKSFYPNVWKTLKKVHLLNYIFVLIKWKHFVCYLYKLFSMRKKFFRQRIWKFFLFPLRFS